MRSLLRTLAAAGAAIGFAGEGAIAQSAAEAGFTAAGDSAVRRAADSLELTPPQREAFYANVDTAVAIVAMSDSSGARASVDSALSVVVRETGRKLRFVRHARAVFSDMFARRQGDPDRRPGTEEELWRSPINVTGLIELYRDNPEASDQDMERAMAAVFRRP
jgi:hypothetical protein